MSERRLRITLLTLTLIGIGVASYLTYIHYAGIKPLCGRNGGGCEIVQTSEYSKLAGVPVALIGLIGYLSILAALLAERVHPLRRRGPHGRGLRLQRVSDLSRGVLDPQHLRVVRVELRDHCRAHVPVDLAVPAQ
jgi:hypothetical protein